MAPFQGKQNSDSGEFAGIELGLGMVDMRPHPVIDTAENLDDNIFGGHWGAPQADWRLLSIFAPLSTSFH